MNTSNYADALAAHVGHAMTCETFGDEGPWSEFCRWVPSIAVVCEDCELIVLEFDRNATP